MATTFLSAYGEFEEKASNDGGRRIVGGADEVEFGQSNLLIFLNEWMCSVYKPGHHLHLKAVRTWLPPELVNVQANEPVKDRVAEALKNITDDATATFRMTIIFMKVMAGPRDTKRQQVQSGVLLSLWCLRSDHNKQLHFPLSPSPDCPPLQGPMLVLSSSVIMACYSYLWETVRWEDVLNVR
ncbi:hypothetical protein VNO77_34369 [Canavalia gladiata]|uniref:Uncharacterized protein n=1 Tax=Canavalia gladiata TaxID=3824 RepID=A0AAN9KE64_CANGL